MLLDDKQRKEAAETIISRMGQNESAVKHPCATRSVSVPFQYAEQPLTEIRKGDLYFCLEHRLVTVRDQEIALTVKEFDILALLIMNPKRVFTYELITDLVWNEDYTYYSRKAINNHVSNLRKKLKIRPGDPNYIKTVIGIGYKFTLP